MFEKEPDLLTRRQAQELLHVSKNTILKMIHEEELPAIIVAGSYRIEKNTFGIPGENGIISKNKSPA